MYPLTFFCNWNWVCSFKNDLGMIQDGWMGLTTKLTCSGIEQGRTTLPGADGWKFWARKGGELMTTVKTDAAKREKTEMSLQPAANWEPPSSSWRGRKKLPTDFPFRQESCLGSEQCGAWSRENALLFSVPDPRRAPVPSVLLLPGWKAWQRMRQRTHLCILQWGSFWLSVLQLCSCTLREPRRVTLASGNRHQKLGPVQLHFTLCLIAVLFWRQVLQ